MIDGRMGARRWVAIFALQSLILFSQASVDPSSFSSLGQPAARPNVDPGFDMLLLVRTWPPTFCEQLREQREECTALPLQEFTLHGVWPEYSSGGWPQYCATTAAEDSFTTAKEAENNNYQRESSAPKSIYPGIDGEDDDDGKIRCEWPSFHGSTQNFWDHEWDKHGTCAAPLLGNRSEFFKTAMHLHDQFNLNRLFRSQGIWPVGNSQGMFESTEAARAIKQEWGVTPRLACHKGSLAEVWICLDLDLNLIECPRKVKPGEMCGIQFRMPAGSQVIN